MSDYIFYVDAVCPLCGFRNELKLESGHHMVSCDVDEGGCEEYFGLRLEYVPLVTTYKLVEASPPSDVAPPAAICSVHGVPMIPMKRGSLRPDEWYCPCGGDHGYCNEVVKYE